MDLPGIKNIYESGITALNFIKLLITIDIFVVLVMAVLKSSPAHIINSALFSSAVIIFIVYREHFRSGTRNLTGIEDWKTIKSRFEGSLLSNLGGIEP